MCLVIRALISQDQETLEEESSFEAESRAPSVPQSVKEELENLSSTKTTDDDDDAMSYFARLAEE